jgi:hypothetical protein
MPTLQSAAFAAPNAATFIATASTHPESVIFMVFSSDFHDNGSYPASFM